MVRVKNRYLLAEIIYDDNKVHDIQESRLYHAIRQAFTDAFGEYGIALVKRSLNVRFVREDTRMILVKVRRGAEGMLSNAFLTIKSLGGVSMKIVTRHCSGSIRCAQKFWIRYNRRLLSAAIADCNAEERQMLMKEIEEINKTDLSSMFKGRRRTAVDTS